MESETSIAGEDGWTPKTIHSVKQKIQSTLSINGNGLEFFTITALVNNRPIKFFKNKKFTGYINTEVTIQQNNTITLYGNRIQGRK